ncbi:fatty acid CoA ligase family protein [Nocardia huaxiensis]|uniref:AMP-binding protein n=1 Tax=Nocardia huaxiensis TaxID=2755382 RepID=A0A7D6ZLN9_9NOCA|nr:fatty acid CoA ligase family protein [Nocardia huaxiensis]QLY30323.1 AMP-binding protein [Nocardia huaxiensis]UFS96043.1 AMP-binding protein [Nocardia huaxiensis]
MTAASEGRATSSAAEDLDILLQRQVEKYAAMPAVTYPTVRNADRAPSAEALDFAQLTFRELGERIDAYARSFVEIGIGKGVKTIVMVRPDPDLFAVIFALFRVGAVPVVVDPGMGVRRMLHCFQSVGAQAFIGVPRAHAVRLAARRTFREIRVQVTAGRSFWGGHTLEELAERGKTAAPVRITHRPDDLLMIAFTTGSTGPAKGVEFTRAGFAASLRVVTDLHGRTDGFTSLVTVPLFGIFDLLQGAHLILGPVDPVRVAQADPALLVDVAKRFRVTDLTASPALLGPLGEHLRHSASPARGATPAEQRVQLPDLTTVISMGAPANLSALGGVRAALGPRARVFTTYGATEALPLTTLEWSELDEMRARTLDGAGTCVGRALPETDSDTRVRLIRITDDEIPYWSDDLEVAPGEVGEIVATGGQVSKSYHRNPAANARAKIDERLPDGTVRRWHRVGDLAWRDASGALWFCGRISQRVRTAAGDMFTVRCEQVFTAHPDVHRTALVGVGRPGAEVPVLCYELREGVDPAEAPRVERELWRLAATRELTAPIRTFLHHSGFPVDIRHNAKIGREQLAVWAAQRLGYDKAGADKPSADKPSADSELGNPTPMKVSKQR